MIKLSDGTTFETEEEYFAYLDAVIAEAVARSRMADQRRKADERRYPLLNIQNWSWQKYERWKEGEKVRN